MKWLDSGSWDSIDIETSTALLFLVLYWMIEWCDRLVDLSLSSLNILAPLISFSHPIHFRLLFRLHSIRHMRTCTHVLGPLDTELNWTQYIRRSIFRARYIYIFHAISIRVMNWRIPLSDRHAISTESCDILDWYACFFFTYTEYHQYFWYFLCSMKGKYEPQKNSEMPTVHTCAQSLIHCERAIFKAYAEWIHFWWDKHTEWMMQ